jgi:hypothetical protein
VTSALNRYSAAVGLALIVPLFVGCGSPHKANIDLRRKNAELEAEVNRLRSLVGTAPAAPLEAGTASGSMTRPQLYVPTRIVLGRLTGVRGDTLSVYASPVDAAGDAIKWPGDFTITAFDLSQPSGAPVGTWHFAGADVANAWHSGGLVFEYVLDCPLAAPPAPGTQLTVRVAFAEPYTPQTIVSQTVITVAAP